jgi:hypothetical protein
MKNSDNMGHSCLIKKTTTQEININLTIGVVPIYESNGIIGIEIDNLHILGYNSDRFKMVSFHLVQ